MTASTLSPTDRASFDSAMSRVLSDHAMLRHMAVAMTKRSTFSADETLSLTEAMTTHEDAEARLFALPFVTRPPKIVTSTAERARRRCLEYTSGDIHLPEPAAAAALVVDALLAHLTAEEAWLADEKKHQYERSLTIA